MDGEAPKAEGCKAMCKKQNVDMREAEKEQRFIMDTIAQFITGNPDATYAENKDEEE